jgi:hypothetical protein
MGQPPTTIDISDARALAVPCRHFFGRVPPGDEARAIVMPAIG